MARDAADQEQQVQVLLVLADCHSQLNEFGATVAVARKAQALAQRLRDERAAGIALRFEGQGLHFQGRNLEARERAEQACTRLAEAGDSEEQGWAHYLLAAIYQALGEFHEARAHLDAARELFTGSRCAHGEILTVHVLGNLYYHHNDLQGAVQCYDRALATARQVGYGAQEAIELAHLAIGHTLLGNLDAARQYAEAGLKVSRQQGTRLWEGYAVYWLGHIEYELGNVDRAQDLMIEALALLGQVNYQAGVCWVQNRLSCLYRDLGGVANLHQALALAQEAYTVACQAGSPEDQIYALSNQGMAHLGLGNPTEALSCSQRAVQLAGQRTLNDIAAATQCSERGMRILLDALCPLGLLSKSGGEYALTPPSEAYLVRDKPTYYGDWCLETQLVWEARGRIAEGVRTGKAVGLDASRPDAEDLWTQDLANALLNWPQRAEKAWEIWETLGISSETKPGLHILDAACGHGVKSFMLAQADSEARVTALDFPKVLELAAEVAEEMGVAKQITFLPGDVLTADFGTEQFDIVFFGAILYYFNSEQIRGILQRVHKALKPGGLLVINETIADEERCRNEVALMVALQLFIFAPQSEVYTFSEYKELLEKEGFTKVTQHSDLLISASKK